VSKDAGVRAAATLRAALHEETEAMLAETERLARIDSGSHDADGVERVAAAVAEMLARDGFELSRESLAGHADRLAATLVLGPGPKLLIVGHADTVWPAGTAASWQPQRDGPMLSGPGVGDMKGCLVMAVHALAAARRVGIDGVGSVQMLIVPDEELGSVGSREWIERHAHGAAACLGLEAGWPGGGVVVQRGAVGALRILARGRSAHCAAHEDAGASAVAALAPLVRALEASGRIPSKGRLRVGVFRGGVARQVVPDHAELLVDLRAPDASAAQALLDGVHELVARSASEGVVLSVEGGITRPPFPPERSRELWELAQRCGRDLAVPLHAVASRGGSDASFAAALGVPTLDGLGPICHDSCARGERIETASLAQRGALLALLIVELAARWRKLA
jgi:glutamate carboxypeptidase